MFITGCFCLSPTPMCEFIKFQWCRMYQLNNNSEHSLRFTVHARFNSTTQVLMTLTGVADDKSSWLLAYYLPQLQNRNEKRWNTHLKLENGLFYSKQQSVLTIVSHIQTWMSPNLFSLKDSTHLFLLFCACDGKQEQCLESRVYICDISQRAY